MLPLEDSSFLQFQLEIVRQLAHPEELTLPVILIVGGFALGFCCLAWALFTAKPQPEKTIWDAFLEIDEIKITIKETHDDASPASGQLPESTEKQTNVD